LRYISYLLLITCITASCAVQSRRVSVSPCSGELDTPFSPCGGGKQISIVGRAKIVLPKYRVRGICRIRSDPSGGLVIDFEHSSLFGAYREDATIMLEGEELIIIDRERERMYDNEASLSMLGSQLAFDLFPDDIRYALLFDVPACAEIDGLAVDSRDGRWNLSGEWRGRSIEIEGFGGLGPDRFTLCTKDNDNCYTISYKHGTNGFYPRSLEMVKEGGRERIYLEIIDVEFSSAPEGGNR
jgi:hypothetical protein